MPYHKDHPEQPIMGTEMGSTVTTRGIYTKDTVNAYVPDEDITAPLVGKYGRTMVDVGRRQTLVDGWICMDRF